MQSQPSVRKTIHALIGAGISLALLAPIPGHAGDWGISLDVPFFRVRAHDGYYYRDNDHRHGYRHHYHKPDKHYYYYPSRWRDSGTTTERIRHNPDGGGIDHSTTRRYRGPNGETYEWSEHHRHD